MRFPRSARESARAPSERSLAIRLAMVALGLVGVGFVITRPTRETVLESV